MGSIQHHKVWMPSEAQWSKFIHDLSPTCVADSTNEINFDKIGVLAKYSYEFGASLCYLYYIDLSSAHKDNDNSIQSVQPILQFQEIYGSHVYCAFLVVGFKLFLFGGYDPLKGWSINWCYYDFSKDVDFPKGPKFTPVTHIEEEDLQWGPPMKGRKCEPVAVVVGSNKICVFATVLHDKDELKIKVSRYSKCEPPNFEIYDTVHACWSELPEPAEYSKYKLDKISIHSYCIDRSCLIIWTDIGIYGIHAYDPNANWVKMMGTVERGPLSDRWEMVGNYMCSPFEVARLEEEQSHPFAFTKGEGSLTPYDGLGVLCSERISDDVFLCSVQGTVMHGSVPGNGTLTTLPAATPILLVNVVRFDIMLSEKLRADMWNPIQSDKSAIVADECYSDFFMMDLIGCFRFEGTVKVDAVRKTKFKVKAVEKVASVAIKDNRSTTGTSFVVFGSVMATLLVAFKILKKKIP